MKTKETRGFLSIYFLKICDYYIKNTFGTQNLSFDFLVVSFMEVRR